MQLISKYIKHAPKDISITDFCRGVTEYIHKEYKSSQLDRLADHPEERLTASCIVYSRLQRQIWMIGDCQCMVGNQYYDNPKHDEAVIAEKRAEINNKLLSSGQSTIEELRNNDIGRKEIIPMMIASMRDQNKTYSVVDGFHIPIDKVRIITLDFEPWTIVMASDGYPFLKPTLAESEAALKQQLDTDPLNINTFKATKAFLAGNNSFDDRTYIRFNV